MGGKKREDKWGEREKKEGGGIGGSLLNVGFWRIGCGLMKFWEIDLMIRNIKIKTTILLLLKKWN